MKIIVISEISTGLEIIKVGAIGEIQDDRISFNPDDVEGMSLGSSPTWDSISFLNNYVGQYTFTTETKKKEILPFDQFIRENSIEDSKIRKRNLIVIDHLRDYLTLLLNNPRTVGVVFVEDPKAGYIGFNLVYSKQAAGEEVEHTNWFQFQHRSAVIEEKKMKSYEELKECYDFAVRNKWAIQHYNDTSKLAVGFIVHNLEGSIYYWAHMSALKKKV